MDKPTRHRPHSLRTVTVPVQGAGRPAPLSNGEKARKVLYTLLKGIPTRQHILIPRNVVEAHRRPDSLCVQLGLPFRVLGPLLLAAMILAVHKRGGLYVSSEGLQLLQNLYNWKDSHQINFEEKKPSEKATGADARTANDPPLARMKYYYIYRGQFVPRYSYKPLVANNLIIEQGNMTRVKDLSDEIVKELDPSVVAIFEKSTTIVVNTRREAGDGDEVPHLITPTESQQQQLQSPAASRSFARTNQQQHGFQSPPTRHVRSPPARTPGASPPLRRIRLAEIEVETVDDEEEKKEEEQEQLPIPPAPPAPPTPPTIADEISACLALDFELRDYNGLRPARNPESQSIEVNDRKQATAAMRGKIVWLADRLGYLAASLQKDKLAIAEAASRVVFYDCGCPVAPKGRMVGVWFNELDRARLNLETDFGKALETDQLGPRKGTYVERIEAAHPNYLRELYRKAGKNPHITFRATFAELAHEMNELSKLEPDRPQLFLTRATLKGWFHGSGGKVRKGWERPILTPDRMAARVEWCKARKAELAAAEEAPTSYHQKYYCFLDEKWFYIRSRHKKMKVLPRGPHEAEGAADIPIEREGSRRHATKVMVLGVIAEPQEEHNFDGKVYFTRVAHNRTLKKTTYSDKVFDDLAANTALHRQWHGYIDRNESADRIISFVAPIFDLDEEMKERLVIRYKDHQDNGKTKWKEFSSFQIDRTIRPQPNVARRPLDTRDLVLQARFKAGEEVPEDVTCDSEFMKAHMDAIGRAIRAKYHWVPEDDEIFLVMDNAGGHGT